MIYVFEDHEEDIISKFFRKAYPDNKSKEFVYAKGNSNVDKIVENLLQITNDTIVVYLDTIPGNKHTAEIYSKLRRKSQMEQYRIIVLPVVCMEYYLIKSLKDSQAMKCLTGVEICINKGLYFNSALISTAEDKKFVKNFEKYCKLILIKNLKQCASHSGKLTEQCYGAYYLNNCICQYAEDDCKREELKTKIHRYLSQFDCVPMDNIIGNGKTLSTDEIWDIHRKLVQEYNDMVEFYINSGNSNVDVSQYKEIKVIK